MARWGSREAGGSRNLREAQTIVLEEMICWGEGGSWKGLTVRA